jgi:hypothetical protein
VITHEREIAARLPRQITMLDGLIVSDTVADRGSPPPHGAPEEITR